MHTNSRTLARARATHTFTHAKLASMASVSAVERLMKKNPNTPPTKA